MKGYFYGCLIVYMLFSNNMLLAESTETPTLIPIPVVTPTPSSAKRLLKTFPVGQERSKDGNIAIFSAVISPDEKYIFTSDSKERVIRWNVETGEMEKVLSYEAYTPGNINISRDGKIISQEGWTDDSYYSRLTRFVLWDVITGKILFNKLLSFDAAGYQLYDNGNKSVFCNRYGGFNIWDIKNDLQIGRYLQDSQILFDRPRVSPQEKYCALVGRQNGYGADNVIIWNMQSQSIHRSFSLYPSVLITDAYWQNDDRIWFKGSTYDGSWINNFTLDLFDINTGDHLYRIAESVPFREACFSKKGDKCLIYGDKVAKIYSTFTGTLLAELPHPDYILCAVFSSDERRVLTSTSNDNAPASAFLWDISDLGDYPIPTLIPYTPTPTFTPTNTYTPTNTFTLSNTPTITPTPTNTPDTAKPILKNNGYSGKLLFSINKYKLINLGRKYGSDDLLLAYRPYEYEDFKYRYIFYDLDSPTLTNTANDPIPYNPAFSYQYGWDSGLVDYAISKDGTPYCLFSVYWNLYQHAILIGNYEAVRKECIISKPVLRCIHIVSPNAKIPGTETGDVIAGNYIIKLDSPEQAVLYPPLKDLDPLYIRSLTEGPDGHLFFLYMGKLLYVDNDGAIRERDHRDLKANKMMYQPYEKEFYFSRSIEKNLLQWIDGSADDWFRISSIDKNIIPVGEFTDLAPHWKRSGFYAKREWKYWGMAFYDIDRTMNPVSESPTNTPAPSAPKPTPTPIPGWFVLDGFGGIHGANPAIQRPVLPYWWNFNIARDIEPDPLGRGWYMLDGFGGIHTSSPDLPKPTNLPYFGFDIARNLKVKEVNGKVEFYLLDCYGVIHSTDAGFNQGSLPIFGEDNARTLRFEPGGNVLLMMDVYGTIYRSDNTMTDTIRFAPPYAISPVMRSFVRFPDETTVMLDLFGGRHTNPYYPAKDIVNGLPGDFYFPGWDIIWDLELVPENWAKQSK